MTNLHYARAFHNSYLLFEAHLHDDAHAKESFNCVLKKNINSPSTYAQSLKDFVNFVES